MTQTTLIRGSLLSLCLILLAGFQGCGLLSSPVPQGPTLAEILDGTYDIEINGVKDEHKHRKYTGDPKATANIKRSGDKVILDGLYDNLSLEGTPDGDDYLLSGQATLAGRPNAPAVFDATATSDGVLEGSLTLGEGVFPNGPIIFELQATAQASAEEAAE